MGQQTRVYSLRPSAAQVQTRAANNAARKAGGVPKPKPPGGQACGYSVNGPTSHSDATVNPAVRRAVRLASS